MNIAVIAEYNPFHRGHAAHLAALRKEHDGAAVIAILSGDLTQRGEPAVIGKYARAEAALACGCDLVLELPAPWCFSGAQFFARGGTAIAEGLGCIDALSFGSESGDVAALTEAAARLASDEFAAELARKRASRPEAGAAALRADAYAALYGDAALFSGSNNLLALEYLSELRRMGSSIAPHTIKRVGGSFGDDALEGICSATAIRRALAEGREVSAFMPDASAKILAREREAGRIYALSRLDTAAAVMLRTASPERLAEFMEISGGMEHRLIRAAREHRSIDAIVEAAAERRYSKSRLRRAILSALIGVRMADAEEPPRFTTLLAANEKGREVLAAARKNASIAIISKPSQLRALDEAAQRQYRLHAAAMSVAELCADAVEPRHAILQNKPQR